MYFKMFCLFLTKWVLIQFDLVSLSVLHYYMKPLCVERLFHFKVKVFMLLKVSVVSTASLILHW